jgi:hypothetical protein
MEPDGYNLRNWKVVSMLAAVVGIAVCAALAWNEPNRLWPAYLLGFLASWLVCVGGMGLLALGNLTGGRWALVARPFYLAANQMAPVLAVAFIPIGLFTERIYGWASATPGSDVAHAVEAGYLDTVFFCQRAAAYFIVWLVLSWLLSAVSRLDVEPAGTPAMRRIGAVTLVLVVPTATFAAFDWGMSLEPNWYSSIYGALLSAGGVLAAHALAICGLAACGVKPMAESGGLALNGSDASGGAGLQGSDQQALEATAARLAPDGESADIFNDLGNLLLAFLMVNTYFAFSQFLIIWSGNLPSEIPWYLRRLGGGWQWLALSIVALHFVVPFLMLLSRDQKRDPRPLRRIALLLVTMYLVHLYWMIAPAFAFHEARGQAINVAGLIGIFGAFLAIFFWRAEAIQRNRATVEI